MYLLDSHGYQTDDQFGTSSGDPHLSRCCDTSSSSPCITTNICHVNQNLAMGQTHSHLPQNHSPRDAANQSSCFQSPSVTTTEIGNRYNSCLHFSVKQLEKSPTAIYIYAQYIFIQMMMYQEVAAGNMTLQCIRWAAHHPISFTKLALVIHYLVLKIVDPRQQ